MNRHDDMLSVHDIRLADMDLRFQVLETASYNGTLIWKIRDYKRRKQEAVAAKTLSLYSQPFYTGYFGYKMCARIYLNGDGMGKGTHLSLFFVVMRGEYDALLPWPFKQKVGTASWLPRQLPGFRLAVTRAGADPGPAGALPTLLSALRQAQGRKRVPSDVSVGRSGSLLKPGPQNCWFPGAECTENFGQFQLAEELIWLGRPNSALIPRALWFSLSICLLLRFFLLTQTLRGCSASVHSYLAGAEPDKHRLGDARHPDLLLNRGGANGPAPVEPWRRAAAPSATPVCLESENACDWSETSHFPSS